VSSTINGKRAARAVVNTLSGRSGSLIDSSEVELRLECRSYELGWILWSFDAGAISQKYNATRIWCETRAGRDDNRL